MNKNLSFLCINQQLAKIANGNKNFFLAFYAKNLKHSAMFHIDNYYPKIGTAYFFTPNIEQKFIKQFKKIYSQVRGQASAIFRVRYFNPNYLIFQHSPVEEEASLNGGDIKMLKDCQLDI